MVLLGSFLRGITHADCQTYTHTPHTHAQDKGDKTKADWPGLEKRQQKTPSVELLQSSIDSEIKDEPKADSPSAHRKEEQKRIHGYPLGEEFLLDADTRNFRHGSIQRGWGVDCLEQDSENCLLTVFWRRRSEWDKPQGSSSQASSPLIFSEIPRLVTVTSAGSRVAYITQSPTYWSVVLMSLTGERKTQMSVDR